MDTKKITAVLENGRWSLLFEGRITMRDMNRLKRGLHVQFNQMVRKRNSERVANRMRRDDGQLKSEPIAQKETANDGRADQSE
jgi:hypothetical protein